ncbi:MAG: sensor histidine kinase [Candidatus Bipolaricaulia bacterium]
MNPRFSLRSKFIWTLALFTIVLSVSFGVISAYQLQGELEQQVINRGERLAESIAPTVANPNNTSASDLSIALNILGIVSQQPLSREFLFVQAVKGDESATVPSEISKRLNLETLSVDERRLTRKHLPDSGMPYFELIMPVESANVTPTYLRIGLSLAYVQQAVQREWLRVAGLSALYITAGLILAFWLYKNILGPVETLTESVKRFKRDMTSRAQVNSGDELETLAEEFNRMADTIQERDKRLENVNEELRRANQVKSEFLSVMGHELKTPLHAIRGYAQLLKEGIDGPVTEAQREDLDNIVTSGDHLRALIDNILHFSKLESGEETLHPEVVEVGRLINEAMQNVQVMAREKGVELRADGDSLQIQADATKLKQVLINLLSNALKCTDEGHIQVSAEPHNGEVVFAVQDTGTGIPESHREQIFEPFTQIDSSTTRPWAGIGLGLSIVKTYVEMHGGRVWVHSHEGEGSAFYFTIPTDMSEGGES